MYEIFKYVEYQCNVKLLWFETRNWEEKYAVLSIFENANWALDLVLYRKEFFIQQKCLSWSDWWKGMQNKQAWWMVRTGQKKQKNNAQTSSFLTFWTNMNAIVDKVTRFWDLIYFYWRKFVICRMNFNSTQRAC